jgi:hypothetical protein
MSKLEEVREYVAKSKESILEGEGDYETLLDGESEDSWSCDERLQTLCREAAEFYRIKAALDEFDLSESELDVVAMNLAQRLSSDLAQHLQLDPEDLGLE